MAKPEATSYYGEPWDGEEAFGARDTYRLVASDLFQAVVEYLDRSGLGAGTLDTLQQWIRNLGELRGKDNPYLKAKIGNQLRRAVMERDRYRCCQCDTWINLTIDHIIPESKDGATVFENLQTLCLNCNAKKGTR